MKTFSGFPEGKERPASIAEAVFTDLLPLIDDLAELKVTLHVLWRLGQPAGKVGYLRRADLAADQVLLAGLGTSPVEALDAALSRAVERGVLLQAVPPGAEAAGELYLANTSSGRAAARAITQGEWPEELELVTRPNIFALYEQNIGMLTPLIADELREAEQVYPAAWIEEAFREAVSLNKRSWKYILAILKRWHAEGKEEKADRPSGDADRRKYIEGEYGEYIKH